MQIEPIAPQTSYTPKKGESYMNDAQKKHFETILLNWKNAILKHSAETVTRLQSDTSPLADPSDRASLEETFSLTLRTRDRERKLVSKIEDALERITNDEFGHCERCDVEIGIPRLEARPTAELCIDCKELEEKKEVQVNTRR